MAKHIVFFIDRWVLFFYWSMGIFAQCLRKETVANWTVWDETEWLIQTSFIERNEKETKESCEMTNLLS